MRSDTCKMDIACIQSVASLDAATLSVLHVPVPQSSPTAALLSHILHPSISIPRSQIGVHSDVAGRRGVARCKLSYGIDETDEAKRRDLGQFVVLGVFIHG